jgi:flavin reductase (DIM6/NTAB) family NADH-FMN oxidoreductase RutF
MAGMSVDRFRRIMGCFPTGVAVVTATEPGGESLGFTANAVASVSLEPRLVLVCVDRKSQSLEGLLASGRFALSFLPADGRDLAERFSFGTREDRFEGVDTRPGNNGSPILTRSVAWVECTLWKTVEAGDHQVVFGRVTEGGLREGEEPLVFHRGRYDTVGR